MASSSSNPLLARAGTGAGAGGGAGSPSKSIPSKLTAPGFRFQPTDEELVSYYLKRKVGGRPLAVDAVAEIDLYKWEPWDLPGLSRLQTGDAQWYFFSTLHRSRYSDRIRTSRATAKGYWKTTGKDRDVKHGPRTVGMKKTLVFHTGRAPRGERSNWVMHEFRLADSQSADAVANVPDQDSFVVCKIFQKSASGPQNGAQYGAPFIEEDWEEGEETIINGLGISDVAPPGPEQDYVHSDNDMIINGEGASDVDVVLYAPSGPEQDYVRSDNDTIFNAKGASDVLLYAPPGSEQDYYVHSDNDTIINGEGASVVALYGIPGPEQDYVHCDIDDFEKALSFQHESTALVATQTEWQDSGSHPDDPASFPEMFYCDTNSTLPWLLDDPNITNNVEENYGIGEQPHNPSDQNGGYVKIEDVSYNANGPTSNSFDGLIMSKNDYIITNGVNEGTTWPGVDGIDLCFGVANEATSAQELTQMCPLAEDGFTLQPYFPNPVAHDYSFGQPTEDSNEFYDAPSTDPHAIDIFANTNNFEISSPDSSCFDMVDNFMAYYDATDNNLHYDISDSLEKAKFVAQPNFVSEVDSTCKTTLQVPETSIELGPSSARFTGPTNQLENVNEDKAAGPDMQVTAGWNNILRKRIVDMLGSISAPPAMAEGSVKGKAVGLLSPTHFSSSAVGLLSPIHSSGSVHASAGLIGVRDISATGSCAEHLTLQKNGEISFLLSYGMADNGVVGRSVCSDPSTKKKGGALAMLLRGGFCLFGLSALILFATIKVGMCVCNK